VYSQKTYSMETGPWHIIDNDFILHSDVLPDQNDLSTVLLSTESSIFMSEIIRDRYGQNLSVVSMKRGMRSGIVIDMENLFGFGPLAVF